MVAVHESGETSARSGRRSSCAARLSVCWVAVGAVEGTEFLGVEFGFFEGGEVAAVGWLGVADDVGGAFEPGSWGVGDVAGEQGEAGGGLDAAGVLVGGDVGVGAVHAHGGADGGGEPVDGEVGEDLVFGEGLLDVAVVVAPGPEFLHDPGGKAGRGVGEAERGGLGLGAVHGDVGALGSGPGGAAVEVGAFVGGEVRGVPGVDGAAGVGAVYRRHPVGVVEGEVAADVAADVAAGGAEAGVAQGGHELGPQAGDGDGVGGRAGGAVGVAEAGDVGDDDIERVGGVGAVRGGVGQEGDDFGVAPERVGPAVGEDQRQGGAGRGGGAGVDVVDPGLPGPDAVAGEPGQRPLLRRPVELVGQVGGEFGEGGQRG